MSLEQAIIEHAGALKELAAAIRETMGNVRQIGMPAAAAAELSPAREAINTALAAARAGAKKAAEVKPDADLEKAVEKVEADAKKPEEKTGTQKEQSGDDGQELVELVYATDVRPVLLTLNKTKGKEELAKLLKKYNAPNGDKIKPADFAAIVADANALLAA